MYNIRKYLIIAIIGSLAVSAMTLAVANKRLEGQVQSATSITRELKSEVDRLSREAESVRLKVDEAQSQSLRQADELGQYRKGREEMMDRLLSLQREKAELEADVTDKKSVLERMEGRVQDYERLEAEYQEAQARLARFQESGSTQSAESSSAPAAEGGDSDFEPGAAPLTSEQLAEIRARIYSKQSEYLKGGYNDLMVKRELAGLHFNLAVVYSHNRDWESAVREYNNTLLLNPDDADAHFNLAVVLAKHFGREEEAVKHYEEYLRLSPGAKDASRVKGWMLDKVIESKFRE